MSFGKHICLVLLVGIPGSGKTFFRKFIEGYFKDNLNPMLGSTQICSVCYDDYCNIKNPANICDGNSWKTERLKLLKVVENILIHIKNNYHNTFKSVFPDISLINEIIENPECVLVLIDDNMYYRSMRYEYFKLAKMYNLSFCQIYFDVAFQDALKYNRKRSLESQIPDSVIEFMLKKIEPPQKTHLWEMNSVFVSSYPDFHDEHIINNIFSCIKSALVNPVIKCNKYLEKEVARDITNSSAIHQIDIALKQLVGGYIKIGLGDRSNKPNIISQYFSDKRLKLLKQIKDGKIVLPIDLTKPINQEDIDLIKPVLSDLLQ